MTNVSVFAQVKQVRKFGRAVNQVVKSRAPSRVPHARVKSRDRPWQWDMFPRAVSIPQNVPYAMKHLTQMINNFGN